MERTGAERIDPLELVDWTDHATAVRATAHTQRTDVEINGEDPAPSYNTSNLALAAHTDQMAALDAIRKRARQHYLALVDDTDNDTADTAYEADGPLVPDVIGAERQRERVPRRYAEPHRK